MAKKQKTSKKYTPTNEEKSKIKNKLIRFLISDRIYARDIFIKLRDSLNIIMKECRNFSVLIKNAIL